MKVSRTDNTLSIEFSEDDLADPYTVALELYGATAGFAETEQGAMSETEYRTLAIIHKQVLGQVHLMDVPSESVVMGGARQFANPAEQGQG